MVESAARDTEVLVLGGGPGGYTAAFRAADLGKRVVLVERYPALGGVCLNVGCIPSKALLHVAFTIGEAAELADHGIAFGAPVLDFVKLRAHKDSVVKRLVSGLAKVSLLSHRARARTRRSLAPLSTGQRRTLRASVAGHVPYSLTW